MNVIPQTNSSTNVRPAPGSANTTNGGNLFGNSTSSTSVGTAGTSNSNAVANAGIFNSAGQCKLPAIDILQVEELDTKTIVRWRDVIGAAGYDVMKRSKSGEFVFIERVTKPIYTAHLARGAVKYEDFKIAAVCGDTQSASVNTSKVTSVKTGPVQFLLMLLLSMNIGAAVMLRKKFQKS